MKEYPVFVPFEGEALASVVTVPDGDPQGLVLLVTGTGAPRSHRFQLWARVARGLAEHGVASVRMDRLGIGDSGGRLPESTFGQPPKEQALAVARFAMRAVGVDRFAVAGNCSGSAVAMAVAADAPECAGAVCILPRLLEPSGVNRMVIDARHSGLADMVRRNRLLRALTKPVRGRKGRPTELVRVSMPQALAHGRLLFIFSREDTDSFNDKSVNTLTRVTRSLSTSHRDRFEVRILPHGPLTGFESVEAQQVVLDALVGWLPGCFPTPARSAQRADAAPH
jgi:pimeloyl-ACP methyl ester carboxylesterase